MPCAPTLALPLIDAAQKDALQHLSAAQHAVLLWLAACGGERGVPASAFKPAGVTYASVSALENLGLVATAKAPEGGLLYRNALVFPNSPLQTPAVCKSPPASRRCPMPEPAGKPAGVSHSARRRGPSRPIWRSRSRRISRKARTSCAWPCAGCGRPGRPASGCCCWPWG